MKKICIITNKYPNPLEPNILVFVQQLVWEFADQGIDCCVVAPLPVNINPKYLNFPYKKIERTDKGNEVKIFMPKYIGFGQSNIFGLNPSKLTTNNFTSAVSRVIKNMEQLPDAVYGHFITPAGIAAARIGEDFDIPSFMAYGEATLNTIKHFGIENTKKELSKIDGIVAVSSKNKNTLVSTGIVEDNKIEVFPNGYRPERFYPRDKIKSREKFDLPYDKFIVSFVGSYDNRKGIKRLEKAIEELEDVYFISAGQGALEPNSNKCLYSGRVDNENLPDFYNASDIFVLPTLNEGCSNAIVEAIACGLPIISSDLPFNNEILDDTNSISVDPRSIEQIKIAINLLYKDRERLQRLHFGSLEKSKYLTLETRANNILNFIEKSSQEFKDANL